MKSLGIALASVLLLPLAANATQDRPYYQGISKLCVKKEASCLSAYKRLFQLTKAYYDKTWAAQAVYNKQYAAFHAENDKLKKSLAKLPDGERKTTLQAAAEKQYWEAFRAMEQTFLIKKQAEVAEPHRALLKEMNELVKRIPEVANNAVVVREQLLTDKADLRFDASLALSSFVRSVRYKDQNRTREFECVDELRKQDARPLKFEDKFEDGYAALILEFWPKDLAPERTKSWISFRIVDDVDRQKEVRPTGEQFGSCAEREERLNEPG